MVKRETDAPAVIRLTSVLIVTLIGYEHKRISVTIVFYCWSVTDFLKARRSGLIPSRSKYRFA
ncbi:MAG: hypothetical protein KI786_12870, partial [Mameliella sp.]|nr:hypothetical protein [Phaeodactylibacter sp.]